MKKSIYAATSEDYPSEDAPDVLDEMELYDMQPMDKPSRPCMALDERIAVNTYAFATRQEKYELYKRFGSVRGSLNLKKYKRHK